MNTLKPCPFCGGKAQVNYENSFMPFKRWYWVVCQVCDLKFPRSQDNEKDAIEDWNDRKG